MKPDRKVLAALLLLAVTVVWGSTFVVVQDAVAHFSVMSFLTWRFAAAGGLLAVLRPRALVRLGARGWARGAMLGAALAGGYVLQTFGLRYTSAAESGFLTGLQVVATPLLAWALFHQRPASRAVVATLVAAAGLGVMSLRSLSFGTGEALTLASAIMFAMQIVGLSRWSTRRDAYGLATVQLLTVAICCTATSLGQGLEVPSTADVWGAVLLTAVAATAIAFVVQTWAQSQLSSTRTALVLTMEPVFAALTAWVVGQPVGTAVLAGGGLVVAAMLLVDALPARPAGAMARALLPRNGTVRPLVLGHAESLDCADYGLAADPAPITGAMATGGGQHGPNGRPAGATAVARRGDVG
jgi:drug/metabolite transporter (DMT)-like permease